MNEMRAPATHHVALHDYRSHLTLMRDEVVSGLRGSPKIMPCKYLYDARGSQLFDAICELPEYYPTRTELAIIEAHAADFAALLGPRVLLVELGSGSSLKTRLLLNQLSRPSAYVPVDISRTHLVTTADRLTHLYPELEILPVCADFNQTFQLPAPQLQASRTAVYFPGSTIGNFEPDDAILLLKKLRRLVGPDSAMLIGVDLRKDPTVLEHAYNDKDGVTAAFNLNLLCRFNRELHGNFDLARFRHYAEFNSAQDRIEMHLVSLYNQSVHIAGETFTFRESEHMITEYSYKYTLPGFAALAAKASLKVEQTWTDDRRWFSVQYLTCE